MITRDSFGAKRPDQITARQVGVSLEAIEAEFPVQFQKFDTKLQKLAVARRQNST